MCGITGFFSRAPNGKERRGELEDALGRLRHRGPDGKGIWQEGGVGLGHTRLSIIDLSNAGRQPMTSADGALVMVFNGEVYNYKSLRNRLRSIGVAIHSESDSEVILAAFSTWGINVVKDFIGMFAIALWNRRERSLYLIRDRLGVKPLYYRWDENELIFASELKALHEFESFVPEIDQAALGEYFQFGYINAPRTIYKNVFKVRPGHILRVGDNELPHSSVYWSISNWSSVPTHLHEDEVYEELNALMKDAFELRLNADVPVGIFLSGGVDSSLVTAVLQKSSSIRNNTFTIGMGDDEFDEATFARHIAEYLNTNHTERILTPACGSEILSQWGTLFDEPFFDSSGIPTLLVSKLASEKVKVVLSADGGDELFSGYNVYASVLEKLRKREKISPVARNAVLRLLNHLPNDLHQRTDISGTWTARLYSVRRTLAVKSSAQLYEEAISIWYPDEIRNLTGAYINVRETLDAYPGTITRKMCLWDLHNYLPGDILTKVDRATMWAGIEGREPLLDHRIVEFAFNLPDHFKRGRLGAKHLLKRAVYEYVPQQLIDRPKRGFAVPLTKWLRSDLKFLLDEYLNMSAIKRNGLLNPTVVQKTIDAFRGGNNAVTNMVWSLIAFQMWEEKWGHKQAPKRICA